MHLVQKKQHDNGSRTRTGMHDTHALTRARTVGDWLFNGQAGHGRGKVIVVVVVVLERRCGRGR